MEAVCVRVTDEEPVWETEAVGEGVFVGVPDAVTVGVSVVDAVGTAVPLGVPVPDAVIPEESVEVCVLD